MVKQIQNMEKENMELFFMVQKSILQEIEDMEVIKTDNFVAKFAKALRINDYSVLD